MRTRRETQAPAGMAGAFASHVRARPSFPPGPRLALKLPEVGLDPVRGNPGRRPCHRASPAAQGPVGPCARHRPSVLSACVGGLRGRLSWQSGASPLPRAALPGRGCIHHTKAARFWRPSVVRTRGADRVESWRRRPPRTTATITATTERDARLRGSRTHNGAQQNRCP
jgi:hypothetical protein